MDARAGTEWLTVREVADHFRVSTKTIHRWITSGELHATRIGPGGRTVRIHRSVIAQMTPTLSAAA
ncbi:helix-turn-helix domain-containing protein [Streptomyces sp. DR3-1]|uniref:helix-turn-helix domain-containing protein n=1 Tax=Streptomyces sp. DR3-1 TaxID=2951169 RepID=UPI002043F209|nr:helix-turn-helix domain-containing protein [Streptomyces sp. DR3-1]MCM3822596.1 helix-turn-helix domain-containing protein [Streptomyces sp. DR3-1]